MPIQRSFYGAAENLVVNTTLQYMYIKNNQFQNVYNIKKIQYVYRMNKYDLKICTEGTNLQKSIYGKITLFLCFATCLLCYKYKKNIIYQN